MIEEGGRNAQYLFLINHAHNLICTRDRPLAPNFKCERPGFGGEFQSDYIDKVNCYFFVITKQIPNHGFLCLN